MLKNTKIVIIGGSSGMGLASARFCLNEGASVVLGGRGHEKLEQAVSELKGSVTFHVLDLLQDESVRSFFETVGLFDHLVVTAGNSANAGGKFSELPSFSKVVEQFEMKTFAQLRAVYFAIQHIRANGSVVLFSGALSRRPGSGSTALASANASLEAAVKGLANEYGPAIRFNCLSPGLTDTPQHHEMPEEKRKGM